MDCRKRSATNTNSMINRQNKHLVDEYLAYRLRFDQLDPKSVRLEQSLALHYLTWAGERLFKDAPKFDVSLMEYVRDYKTDTGEPLSQMYRRKIIGSARNFFTWLTIHKSGFRTITTAWLATLKVRMIQEEFEDGSTVSLDEILQIARTPVRNLVEERVRAGTVFLYLSGMRISAFVSMPIQAVNFHEMEVKQSPKLGVRTKNKKSAVTCLLEQDELLALVKAWDAKVRAALPPEGFWFAPITPFTSEFDLTVKSVGVHRSTAFHKDLRDWLSTNEIEYHSPHAFRRGHANFLFERAKDMNDLEAVRENLMHESLMTTERYARQRRSQRKNRIMQMSKSQEVQPQAGLSTDLISRLEKMASLFEKIDPKMLEMLRSQ